MNWSENELRIKMQRNPNLKVKGEHFRPKLKAYEAIVLEIPMKLQTENKLRAMHPIERGKLLKRQRWVVRDAWLALYGFAVVPLPVTVRFTRIGRRCDPHDALPGAFKACADEVTMLLGERNDDTPQIAFEYAQEPRRGRAEGFRIEITRR
jgi:hypothetical protein